MGTASAAIRSSARRAAGASPRRPRRRAARSAPDEKIRVPAPVIATSRTDTSAAIASAASASPSSVSSASVFWPPPRSVIRPRPRARDSTVGPAHAVEGSGRGLGRRPRREPTSRAAAAVPSDILPVALDAAPTRGHDRGSW